MPRAAQLVGAWHRALGMGAGQRWVGQAAAPPAPPPVSAWGLRAAGLQAGVVSGGLAGRGRVGFGSPGIPLDPAGGGAWGWGLGPW